MVSKMGQQKFLWIFFLVVFAGTAFLPVQAAHANKKYASLVMDSDTGAILHQRNADKMLHPASLTKIMTLLMLFDALDAGRVKMNSRIPISRHAASMVPSKLNLPAGSSIRVKDAIYALVTKSANDVAVAVAEKLGRTETRFANMMTQKARSIGMNRTRFRNASGLHHPKQVTTARDMAKMARYLIDIRSRYYRYFATKKFKYRGKSYRNHNRLMESYTGMDGIKTGYIQASGFNLVASAKRGNKRLIGVVFGGKTSKSRNSHMKELLDAGFRKVGNVRVAAPMHPVKNPRRTRTHQTASVNNVNVPVSTSPSTQQAKVQARLERYKSPALTREALTKTVINRHMSAARKEPVLPEARPVKTASLHTFMTAKTDQSLQGTASIEQVALSSEQISLQDTDLEKRWSIQIGAFARRQTTESILSTAHEQLPEHLRYAYPRIAPVRSQDNWIYRAWLSGFTRGDAKTACLYYKDCMIIDPAS